MHNRVAIFRQFSLTGGIVAEKKRGLKVKFGPSSRQHFPLSSLTQVADKVLSAVVSLTVSHFSYALFFQGPHFLTKMMESNILCDN